MKIEIVGYGWVGRAMEQLFQKHDLHIYDPAMGYKERMHRPDVAIICVPTPVKEDGSLDCSLVEQSVKTSMAPLVIIRSTVMPWTTDRLQQGWQNIVFSEHLTVKQVVFWPEYLGETTNHPLTDQKAREFVILGGKPEGRRKAIELLTTVYNASLQIRQVDSTTAEVIKLSENRAIAFKVAQCQELFDACEKTGLDYYEVQQAVYGDDPRMNLWWTMIYPDKRGFNSKCIPKDVYGWAAWVESLGGDTELTRALLKYNDKLINHE